uniref:hemolysin family protein n=1 Tax=Oculatella sp. LEGE 06141 TaxID=1828648 RepID=UPI0030D89491
MAISTVSQLTGTDVFLRLLSVFLLIAINAFFVTAEFSIVSVRRSRINQLASAGDIQAKTVQDLQRGLDRLLSTTQLGITLSSLALGWIGESTMAVLLAVLLARLPLPLDTTQTLSHSVAIPLAFFLIAYLQIVLGELCPKSMALLYPEQLARVLGPPSLAIARFFNPFIWGLNQSTRWLLRLVGVQYAGQAWSNRISPEELQLIISTSAESPDLEEEERELLTNVFEFAEVTAGEVMVPRISVVAVPHTATFQDLLHEVSVSGHSRYPVMGESLDDILGIIYFKELAAPLVEGVLQLDTPIQAWVRPAQFVPEYLPLHELLHSMQRLGQAMVMVMDEFGGTAGLVTIEDIAAEIIGHNEPESSEELNVQVLNEQSFLVQAQLDIEEVNDLLNLDLPLSEEYQTLGGFMIYQLQKIPVEGELLQYNQWEFRVAVVDGPRLQKIQVQRLDSSDDSDSFNHLEVNDALDASDASDASEPAAIADPWELSSTQPDALAPSAEARSQNDISLPADSSPHSDSSSIHHS